jgi:hypothetical protein
LLLMESLFELKNRKRFDTQRGMCDTIAINLIEL